MRLFTSPLTLMLSFTVLTSTGQTIHGFSFKNYPAKIASSKKAPLNLRSHELGREFRTKIREQYSEGKVDFGGHYIMTLWGAGTGQTVGAMVDVKTGKIYELPLHEGNSNRGVYHDQNNNIFFKAHSNLFICYASSRNENDNKKVDLIYYFYKWNDVTKKFQLLKTKEITTEIIDD